MRTSHRIPTYKLHRPSGQARVIIDGRHIYLGKFGSDKSRERYARLISELAILPADLLRSSFPVKRHETSVNELLLQYWDFAKRYYAKNGKPTKELAGMRDAMRTLRLLYGESDVREFGPMALKAVRSHMITKEKLSRGVINNRINRIRRIFKWAVSEELIPVEIYEALRTVAGLRFGRSEARETEPVRPVNDQDVATTLMFLSPPVSAMVRLQRVTGMRPCEVTQMRLAEIDRSGGVWIYEPYDHKNRWRGHSRKVALGPQAQEILKPFLEMPADAFLFSPRKADEWRRVQTRVNAAARKPRTTPIYPSELIARERRRAERITQKRQRPLRDRYCTDSYRRAVDYAIACAKRNGMPVRHWHPNQLRHSRATEVRREYGVEGAQVVLGHARADVTQIYAETNAKLAEKIALQNG
ncbi:MAG: site-specific integrase [Planctomycetes bacterium]|nr:site-specific integrase [Planctomycetota bacterium]